MIDYNIRMDPHPPIPAAAVQQHKARKSSARKSTIYRVHQIIWYVLWIVEAIILTRILLKLLGASMESSFVRFIYELSAPLVAPYIGMFPDSVIEKTIIEWSAITAALVYGIITLAATNLIKLVKPTTPEEVEATIS